VLGISRGSVYHQAHPVSDADRHLMHRMDNLHTEFPFAGARMLRGLLAQDGFQVGRLHVATLMRRMGVEALYRRPNTRCLGRVDKRDSQSATVMIQGWKLGANHDPRPDRHRSLGADRPVPAA
jgi:hypothetical protein